MWYFGYNIYFKTIICSSVRMKQSHQIPLIWMFSSLDRQERGSKGNFDTTYSKVVWTVAVCKVRRWFHKDNSKTGYSIQLQLGLVMKSYHKTLVFHLVFAPCYTLSSRQMSEGLWRTVSFQTWWKNICDMIKGNESLVEKFQFLVSYCTFS